MLDGNRQSGVGHALMERCHDGQPFAVVHLVPARDLRERAAAAQAELGCWIDEADGDTWRFLCHRLY